MAELSINQKKEWAKMLFLQNDLLQKEIAAKVGTSEKTLSNWLKKEKWEELRTASFISKEQNIKRTYLMIDALMLEIETSVTKVPTPSQADTLAKLAATVRSMETEVGIAQIVDVAKEFTNWLKLHDLKKAQDFIVYLDGFIKHKLKAV